jgi:hypothetical protein
MPGREVGELEIFLLFLLGRDVLTTEDGLGLSPNSVAEAKTLEPCVGAGHVEADLEENTTAPYLARQMSMDFMSQEHGVPHEDPKIRTQGAVRVRPWIATKHGDRRLETLEHTPHYRETPSFTQVQGPHGEVKPLLPVFLYYDTIPCE